MIYPPGLTALLAVGLLGQRVVAAPSSVSRSGSSFPWGSCESFGVNSTDPSFQCGYLEVPMDYHDSSAGNARLAVIKYAATAEKLGTLFVNPGGPGGSGFVAIELYGQAYSQLFQGTYDIVTWDPRGVGYTFPGELYIFDDTAEDAAYWKNTVHSYINETISGEFDKQDLEELYSRVDQTEGKYKDFNERCVNSPSGPYLKYLGTSSTVRDLVSLGDAIVGQGEPIDFWGFSYGTVLGFNFLNMFPERAGHVILDGVVDPNTWITYKILHSSLVDTEKTYSGLTDGCAVAGRAGCKLVEITGDGASGDDVKNLINDAHDVALELYRAGYDVPANPGFLTDWLFNLLYLPMTWSEGVNGFLYEYVALVLQASQAHNVTIPGGRKYNVPPGNITIDDTADTFFPNRTSYSQAAIAGADDFEDGNTTISNIFDIIVENTREVTPTFGAIWSLGYFSYGWPVRSVERLPTYSPKQLKHPALVIGNAADPVTPFASAQKVANMLGNNAFLLEQLGFGHTSIAQVSSCTLGVAANYIVNSTLPQGSTAQCPVDDTNLFPALNGSTTVSKRSNLLRRQW
ncbi:Alpha/Beta hydrolase protein [Thelephora terrestris]|uniref:Alpha/Beta hydrolase protein n=1 Tax=Thelephora terrestris TaxID=56493 RepID=A0A9P6HSL4_9AGAM|nr:Alpha/Beta hydrolase protein [Thelephora terrestris]